MKVYLAQTKPYLGDIHKNAKDHYRLIETAIEQKCDLIVFPELSLTGYYLQDLYYDVAINEHDEILDKLRKYSEQISICAGFVYESPDKLYYNAAGFFENGEMTHLHKKVYLPDYTMFEEARYFAAGNSFTVFDTKIGKCGILICEDALHLSSLYILSQSGVQNVFVTSNSPARGIADDNHAAEDTWRLSNKYAASMLTVNLIYVNRVGVEDGVAFWGGSEVFNALGESLCRLKGFEEDGACVEIDDDCIRRARIFAPYFRDEKKDLLKKFLIDRCE